jgi:hypothetical protein
MSLLDQVGGRLGGWWISSGRDLPISGFQIQNPLGAPGSSSSKREARG